MQNLIRLQVFAAIIFLAGPNACHAGPKFDLSSSRIQPLKMAPIQIDSDSSDKEDSIRQKTLADFKKQEKKYQSLQEARKSIHQFQVSPQKKIFSAKSAQVIQHSLTVATFFFLDYWTGSSELFPGLQSGSFSALFRNAFNGKIPSGISNVAQTTALLSIGSTLNFAASKILSWTGFWLIEKLAKSATSLRNFFCQKRLKSKTN
jgi:hypothetical protein